MFSLPGAFNVIWHRSLVYLGRRKDSFNKCLKAFCRFVLVGQTAVLICLSSFVLGREQH
jgi:hypothetical protein